MRIVEQNYVEEDEILELIVILENRILKINEKYINNTEDFEYFYFQSLLTSLTLLYI